VFLILNWLKRDQVEHFPVAKVVPVQREIFFVVRKGRDELFDRVGEKADRVVEAEIDIKLLVLSDVVLTGQQALRLFFNS
jgi:hypothetical protein